jgi:hypothetical protein
MTKRTIKAEMDRRRFLRGVGGVALALPALEAFTSRRAMAQAGAKVYTAFVCEQNGTVPERFYPSALGPLTAGTMMGSAVEDLIPHAADLMVIRGISWTHGNGVGCGHSSGCNTSLTASRATGSSNRSLPTKESADYRISQLLKREPLNLYSGRKSSYLGDAFAYGPGGKVRPADNNPWNVYSRMTGLDKAMTAAPGLAPQIASRDKSITDAVRLQLTDLLKLTSLSKEDRRRLDQHLTSVRDLEMTMTQPMNPTGGSGATTGGSAELIAEIMKLKDAPDTNEAIEAATKAQMSIIALVFATDQTQIATLQIGGGNSGMRYMIDGTLAPSHHFVSHHVLSDGASGTAIPNATELHFKITRLHGRLFKHMVDQLKAFKTVDGRALLDASAAVWMNSLSNGPPHGTNNVPHVIAGTAGGFLKKGVYVDSGGARNSQFLNTMITAAIGGRSAMTPVENFGDAGVPTGFITSMLA